MFNEEQYEKDVDNAFEALSKAQTQDELKEVLANWPEKENYFVKNEEEIPEFTKEEMEDMGYEIEDIQE